MKVPGFAELEAGMVAKDMIDREEKLSRRGDPLLEQSTYYGAFQQLAELKIAGDGVAAADRSKVVVFIDDLDRCTPDKAVRLLEHLKLVLAQPGFIFVLGVAREVLQGLIKHLYEKVYHLPEDLDAGRDYLDKIIQLPVDLPSHDQHFAEHARSILDKPDTLASLPLDEPARERLAALLVKTTGNNPRKLVRQINTSIIDAHVARQIEGLVEWPREEEQEGEDTADE